MRRIALVGTLCCSLICIGSRMKAEENDGDDARMRHVLVISLDGTHALDIARYIAANPHSTLAQLSAGGVNFPNAHTAKPSDSIPATAGIFTGGTPAVTGLWYDDAYNRKLSPAGSACAKVGAIIDLKEGIHLNPAALDVGGGIDPRKAPLDPASCCTPSRPHNLIRVNTIFKFPKNEGLYTAFSKNR